MKKLLLSLFCASILFTHADNIKNPAPSAHEATMPTPQALESQMAAPHISALTITPEFDPALFNVDAKTFLNDLEFTPAEDVKRYYFHSSAGDYKSSEQAQGGGYYRLILGKTANGEIVAQDFYQDIDAPQTAPFLLAAGKEKDFSSEGNNGRIIWYTPEGKVSSIANYQNGKQVDWELTLRNAKPLMRAYRNPHTQKLQLVIYDTAGNIISHINGDTKTFFYPNGSAMLYVDEADKTAAPMAWDEQGKATPVAQVIEQVMQIIEQQTEAIEYFLNNNE